MESLCNASCSPVTGSHSTCITTNTTVILLIFQLICSQLHISVYLLSKLRKWNSMFLFLFFYKIISVTEWLTPSRTHGVRRDTHWKLRTDSWNISPGNWSIALVDSDWASRASNCSVILDQTFLLFPLLPSCVLSSHLVKPQGNSTFAGSTSLSSKQPIIPEIVRHWTTAFTDNFSSKLMLFVNALWLLYVSYFYWDEDLWFRIWMGFLLPEPHCWAVDNLMCAYII